jgi:hypothetical protein
MRFEKNEMLTAKTILIMKRIIIIIILIIIIIQSCDFVSSGSYANAEYYTLYMPTDTLIYNIEKFKNENSTYKVILKGVERKDTVDQNNFYDIAFNITDKNIILYCVVNMYKYDSNSVKIGLVCILTAPETDSAEFIQWKDIPKKKRNDIREIFENRILSKLE